MAVDVFKEYKEVGSAAYLFMKNNPTATPAEFKEHMLDELGIEDDLLAERAELVANKADWQDELDNLDIETIAEMRVILKDIIDNATGVESGLADVWAAVAEWLAKKARKQWLEIAIPDAQDRIDAINDELS